MMCDPAYLWPKPADWPERLAAFIESRRAMPFEWGRNDCATFAAEGLAAMTDNPAWPMLGEWHTRRQAMRELRARGGMFRAVAAWLGEPVTGDAAALVPRGSVVLAEGGMGPTLGLCTDGLRWCAPGATGLVWRPMAGVGVAWRI